MKTIDVLHCMIDAAYDAAVKRPTDQFVSVTIPHDDSEGTISFTMDTSKFTVDQMILHATHIAELTQH